MERRDYLNSLGTYLEDKRKKFVLQAEKRFPALFDDETNLLESGDAGSREGAEVQPDHYPHVTNSAYDRTYEQFED